MSGDAHDVPAHFQTFLAFDFGLRRTGVAVVPAWWERVKLYDILSELQRLVDAFPGHTFDGELFGEGAEFGDLWRLTVVDGSNSSRAGALGSSRDSRKSSRTVSGFTPNRSANPAQTPPRMRPSRNT